MHKKNKKKQKTKKNNKKNIRTKIEENKKLQNAINNLTMMSDIRSAHRAAIIA